MRAFIIAISQPPTKMRGLIIATRQDEENTIDVFFLYKRAFLFSYLYVLNPLASHVLCLPLKSNKLSELIFDVVAVVETV